jgi:hypothetical protein
MPSFRTSLILIASAAVAASSAASASAQIAYTDSKGRQWRQVHTTTARKWTQVEAVCPTDGVTPCDGALGTQDVSGFVWASREDVIELFSEWVPAITATGEAGGAQYTLAGLGFFEVFEETSFSCTVVGCSFGLSGWTSTLVPGSKTNAYAPAVGAGYNPNYGTFTANMTAPIGEINAWRGVWLYIPAAAPSCPADLSGDGTVGPADLAQLLNSWGSPKSAADINGDGAVNAQDLAAMLAAWGDC